MIQAQIIKSKIWQLCNEFSCSFLLIGWQHRHTRQVIKGFIVGPEINYFTIILNIFHMEQREPLSFTLFNGCLWSVLPWFAWKFPFLLPESPPGLGECHHQQWTPWGLHAYWSCWYRQEAGCGCVTPPQGQPGNTNPHL